MLKKFLILTVLLVSQWSFAKEDFSLSKIPDGYPDGRADAPYGSYSTPYKELKDYSDAVNALERKVYGLSNWGEVDEITRAKYAFYLEHLNISLIKKLSNATHVNAFEQEALLSKLRDVYTKVRGVQEQLYETMVRRVDVALPGPNGLQIRKEHLEHILDPLYECNCRKDTLPSSQEQKDYYVKKLNEFLAEKGSIDELHKLDAKYINSLSGYTHLEYVERENGEIWVTEGKAGHVVLAEGKPVKAAGQMVIVKSNKNKISLFVSSNASGSYKPDLMSVKRMVERMAVANGIEIDKMRTTQGDPMGTQTISVLMKAKGMDSKIVKAEMAEVKAEAQRILSAPENFVRLGTNPEINNSLAKCAKAFAQFGAEGTSSPLRLTYTPK